jgi:hypothetical protein
LILIEEELIDDEAEAELNHFILPWSWQMYVNSLNFTRLCLYCYALITNIEGKYCLFMQWCYANPRKNLGCERQWICVKGSTNTCISAKKLMFAFIPYWTYLIVRRLSALSLT